MTDITTRLLSMSEAMYMDRDHDELDALLLEAKADIERLREEASTAADLLAVLKAIQKVGILNPTNSMAVHKTVTDLNAAVAKAEGSHNGLRRL
jgi:hypothetical protein